MWKISSINRVVTVWKLNEKITANSGQQADCDETDKVFSPQVRPMEDLKTLWNYKRSKGFPKNMITEPW
ncbi:MAG: hypothetical protein NPIRA01_09810 [Nitrospirales bacterium]|nr:MAG: hypothetical protein NPIRA01_09810 [Nitrospirales bacterium]